MMLIRKIGVGLFALLCVGYFLYGLFGPGTGLVGDPDRVTITFWNGFTGPDGRTMLGMVKRFNEENPDVHVQMQRVAWGTYYNKLFVAGIGNRAPEVFVIHTDILPRFAETDMIAPIDDLVEGPGGIDIDDIDPNVWAAVARGGVHYALPLDVHPQGLYYNRALFRQAGIVDENGEARPPRNREEFLDAARRMTRDLDGNGSIDQWGFIITWPRTNAITLISQFGGRFFNEDQSECVADMTPNLRALAFLRALVEEHKVAPAPQEFESWTGFRQGKVGMAFEGIYMLADLEKQTDLDYAGAPVPTLGVQSGVWAGSHNLCLSADMDERTRQAAWRFVKYLSDNSLEWAEGGQVPVRRSLRETERFEAMEIQAQFAKQVPFVRYGPRVPFVFEFYTAFDYGVDQVLRGNIDPEPALRSVVKETNEAIERRREAREYMEEQADGE